LRRTVPAPSTVPARPRLGPAYCPPVRDLRGASIRRAAVAGLLLSTALLSGCAEKTEARDTLPTASAAPTTEELPSVGPADFPVPDQARTKDAAGAEAFVHYFVELLNKQQDVPAGQPIRDLGPDCQECFRIANDLDEAAAAQRRFQGGELSVAGDFGTTLKDDGTVNLSFIARVEGGALVEPSGTPVPGTEAGPVDRLPSAVLLEWSVETQCWQVKAMNLG
jgi:hypothetical protein